jgi:NAD(P)-dependent dehydrogenase (short-subunit alcohol dehydrogenase family)
VNREGEAEKDAQHNQKLAEILGWWSNDCGILIEGPVCDVMHWELLPPTAVRAQVATLPRIISKRWPESPGIDVLVNNAGEIEGRRR